MNTSPLIQLREVTKSYRSGDTGAAILRGISLNIEQGMGLALLGPSGAGKSTLLHIIGGLDVPSSGQVLFQERDLYGLSPAKLSHFRNSIVGFIFQFHHLLPDFTILDNVCLPLLIRGESRHRAYERGRVFLEKVGLADKQSRRPQQLSGGEQQRVAIARALIGQPRMVLADEPTGNLDTNTGNKIFDLLLELNSECNTTLLIATHNQALAERLNNTLYLSDGQITSS